MAITTTIVTPSAGSWTSLGTVGVIVVQNGGAANRFAFADNDPTTLADGFRLPIDAPYIPPTGLTGWDSAKLWVKGTAQVIVAK